MENSTCFLQIIFESFPKGIFKKKLSWDSGTYIEIFICLIREGFIRRKKIVKFHNFGPDIPPPKVVKPHFLFFLLHDQKTIMFKTRKIPPWKLKKLSKQSK